MFDIYSPICYNSPMNKQPKQPIIRKKNGKIAVGFRIDPAFQAMFDQLQEWRGIDYKSDLLSQLIWDAWNLEQNDRQEGEFQPISADDLG